MTPSTPSDDQPEPLDQPPPQPQRPDRGPETCADRTAKARNGDSQAWNQIMEIYSPIVDAIFRMKGLPPNDWSVLRNEVWFRLYKWLPQFQGGQTGRFRKGLRTISRRTADAYIRGRISDPMKLLDSDGEDDPSLADLSVDDHNFLDLAEQIDREEILKKVLPLLADRTAEILSLAFHEGKNATEIGEVLGMTPEAVRKVKSRAMAELRTMVLDHYGFNPFSSEL